MGTEGELTGRPSHVGHGDAAQGRHGVVQTGMEAGVLAHGTTGASQGDKEEGVSPGLKLHLRILISEVVTRHDLSGCLLKS